MASVTLTAAMRQNLLSLQSTATLMGSTQYKLATGNKINSALDSPTSFFAAQGLNNRAGDLSALIDGMGQAIQTIKAADNAMTNITTLVNQAKSIAQSAKDTATAATGGSFTSGMMSATEAANLTASKFAAADTIDITSSAAGGLKSFAITAGMSLATLAATIDADANFTASVETSTLNGATVSRLKVSATNTTATLTYANNGNTTPVAKLAGTTVAGGSTGVDSGDTVGGDIDMTTGDIAAASTGAPTDSTLVTQYNALITQIDQMVSDAGYRGTNLLNSNNLVTQFNEGNTSSQTVTGVNMKSVVGGGGSKITLTTATFTDAANIQTDLDKIEASLTNIRNQQKSFGNSLSVIQTRNDFTTNLVNVLKDGASALVLADKNEEGANMLSLQTSQQLGIQALSLASQANQSVLRLFS